MIERPRAPTAGGKGVTSSPTFTGCLVARLVRGFFEKGEPMGLLPSGRLPTTVDPIVRCPAWATKGSNDLRGGASGNVVSKCHPRKVADKNKSAMPKIILAHSRHCRHIERMKTNATDGLDWYLARCNNGRGRLTPESKRLLKAGYISLRWTSAVTWVLQITEKGRRALTVADEGK